MSYEATLVRDYDSARKRLQNGYEDGSKVSRLERQVQEQRTSFAARCGEFQKQIEHLTIKIFEVQGEARRANKTLECFFGNPDNEMELGIRPVSIHKILAFVCKSEGTNRIEIFSDRRRKELCLTRHVIYYLCQRLTRRSLSEIGRHLGNRDHTTILHGANRIRAMLIDNAEMAQKIMFYEQQLVSVNSVNSGNGTAVEAAKRSAIV